MLVNLRRLGIIVASEGSVFFSPVTFHLIIRRNVYCAMI